MAQGFAIQNVVAPLLAAAGSVTLPTGAYLQAIVIGNVTANAITGGLKIGTTLGATDVVATVAVGANALIHITDAAILKRVFSSIASQQLFIDAVTAWNGAIVNI